MIAQIPFFGLDPKQIDEKWVEAGYGLEANIFDGHSFGEADYIKTFNQTLEYAKQLDPSLLTLHFPTDHADYVHEDHIKKQLYHFAELAVKYGAKGITVHANQFMTVEEFQVYDLEGNRKKIVEFFAEFDERLKGTDIWIGVENLPIIGNLGEDFDPIFIYPEDFTELVQLDLKHVGITWDLCHWAITYQTHLSSALMFRNDQLKYPDFFQFLSIKESIKHYHFSSFRQLAFPHGGVRCFEGRHPSEGTIAEELLRRAADTLQELYRNQDTGIVFEVMEEDYTERRESWRTLEWFGGVSDDEDQKRV
ncbi:sugar phosphate isomerase/epimerase family protein [Bacillus velezensis]|uniref:sugar phosphate isomerase/epimerase family protein n=1 Tax=Bacillus velezensis TaxID=492670 RepID=UPI000BEAF992|nr:TIM barrel protein [Bacillus velezensis]ATL40953.1 endonuclease [Bacillus velezensis]USQ53153.1 sugar phosphate isomerase/epimerase [Bacillus velezensis]UUY37840.1 sugar phosphate isomerase/epimerase [Bacillus velezensis]WJD55932.1 TIM barrel protein [Bacillus velezensis]